MALEVGAPEMGCLVVPRVGDRNQTPYLARGSQCFAIVLCAFATPFNLCRCIRSGPPLNAEYAQSDVYVFFLKIIVVVLIVRHLEV